MKNHLKPHRSLAISLSTIYTYDHQARRPRPNCRLLALDDQTLHSIYRTCERVAAKTTMLNAHTITSSALARGGCSRTALPRPLCAVQQHRWRRTTHRPPSRARRSTACPAASSDGKPSSAPVSPFGTTSTGSTSTSTGSTSTTTGSTSTTTSSNGTAAAAAAKPASPKDRPWSLHSWTWRGHKINYAVRCRLRAAAARIGCVWCSVGLLLPCLLLRPAACYRLPYS